MSAHNRGAKSAIIPSFPTVSAPHSVQVDVFGPGPPAASPAACTGPAVSRPPSRPGRRIRGPHCARRQVLRPGLRAARPDTLRRVGPLVPRRPGSMLECRLGRHTCHSHMSPFKHPSGLILNLGTLGPSLTSQSLGSLVRTIIGTSSHV